MRLGVSTRGNGAAQIGLKLAVFNATRSRYGMTCQMFVTIYGLTVFSLYLSWTLTAADVGNSTLAGLEVATVILHGVFFIAAFFL